VTVADRTIKPITAVALLDAGGLSRIRPCVSDEFSRP
jgi:hypothetical protein